MGIFILSIAINYYTERQPQESPKNREYKCCD